MNYSLQKLNSENDLKECAEIMSTSEPWITFKRTYETALLIFNDKYADVYVAKNESGFLGFVIMNTQGSIAPFIQSIGVKKEYRGKGMGTALIRDIEKIYFEKSPNIFLCVSSFNENAKKLYLKLGYELVGELKDCIVRGHSEFILRKSMCPTTDFKIKEEKSSSEEVAINTDKSKLNLDLIHQVLTASYWSPGISKERVATGIKNSLCFGLYKSGIQIGFARVLTDFTRFAYLLDVFIVDKHKGKGYGKLLLKYILEREELQVDKWLLGTRDAHSLYAKFGFTQLKESNRIMEKKK
jgi:ribosomal protein S18 acetylase RimI-like enzyme